MVPPSFLTRRMFLRSTLVAVSGSMIRRTASTAMGESNSQLEETTLELREVLTQLMRVYLLEISTGIDRLFLITSSEVSKALWNPKSQHPYPRR